MHDDTATRADLAPDAPLARPFPGASPYDEYVHAHVLNTLQNPLTKSADEMCFLVTTQVMELWFTLIVHEWRTAQEAFAMDDLTAALGALRRSSRAMETLCASWRPLSALTPAQFEGFRSALGKASGVQSAMYRHLEFLIGLKSEALLRAHRGKPSVHESLCRAYLQPSLYDEVLRYLHRHGLPVPRAVCERDVTAPYAAHPGVVEAWRHIYTGPQHHPLVALGESLTDIAEGFTRWRTAHVMAVRRILGTKAGSAGSSGLAWLETRAREPVFPELWEVRGVL
ncbi:tryptophan 2,3-dioxygenase [Streptomyces sp. NPDC020800]|uniref:tryptophan 2,3-dioxygenase n=1 Tax=Streptomyces sp. NPDC020800 TaxID=3365092 RepID=UPI0037984FB1